MRPRLLFAAGCAVLAAAVAVPLATSGGASSATPALAVTGFQSQEDAVSLIDRNARALDVVGVDGVTLAASGASVPAPSARARAQLARAHADGVSAEFLVSNFSGAIGDFSEPVAWKLLGTAAHRATVAGQLAAAVRAQGWDGVNVDLESLKARDTAGLVDLLHRLRAALPAGATLSIDLMAATSAADYRGWGYDLPAIAAAVDRVALMTYDQHGPWEDTPGPVGALPWARQCVATLVAGGVPKTMLDLGVAGYGYGWRPHSNDQLSDAQARALVAKDHATARWNASAGEWTATLADGSTLWWSDARSYTVRRQLAGSLGLHGLAVWSLGLSDPLPA